MNIPKKVLGYWFFLTGFIAFGLVGYMQMYPNMPVKNVYWPISIIFISFVGSWYALFDYAKQQGG